MPPPLLEIKGLSKSFGRTPALQEVGLTVEYGEIHGLVGLNGSGKSTLLHILSGNPVIQGTGGFTGEIRLKGIPYHPTPRAAMTHGVGMLHQEPLLLQHLSVSRNISLGREPVHSIAAQWLGKSVSPVDRCQLNRRAEALLGDLGVTVSPQTPVSAVSFNRRPFISLAREMGNGTHALLLLDEPTASLGGDDISRIYKTASRFAADGGAVILVSHRLPEVFSLCHRVTVLRDGRVAGRLEKDDFRVESVVPLMTSHRPVARRAAPSAPANDVLLSMKNLTASVSGETLKGLCLDIREGEILGLAGLAGHGKLALAPALLGLCPASGSIAWGAKRRLPLQSAHDLLKNHAAYVPEDRRQAGLLLEHSVMDNIVFSAMQQKGRFLRSFPVLSLRLGQGRAMRRYASKILEKLDIRCTSLRQKAGELSGGNQQKVSLARALALEPRLLMISEPTRGIDISARETVLALLASAPAKGMTVLLASSEIEDLRRVCHRIALIHEGKLATILPPDTPENEINRLMCDSLRDWRL